MASRTKGHQLEHFVANARTTAATAVVVHGCIIYYRGYQCIELVACYRRDRGHEGLPHLHGQFSSLPYVTWLRAR